MISGKSARAKAAWKRWTADGTLARDARPAFYLEDVSRADFFSITAPRTAGGNFALNGVKDLRIGWSRAAADTVLDAADSKTV